MGFIQIRTLLLDVGITTMGAYQSAGVVTDLMMFSRCIPFRSAWTFSVTGRGGRAGCSNGEGLDTLVELNVVHVRHFPQPLDNLRTFFFDACLFEYVQSFPKAGGL